MAVSTKRGTGTHRPDLAAAETFCCKDFATSLKLAGFKMHSFSRHLHLLRGEPRLRFGSFNGC